MESSVLLGLTFFGVVKFFVVAGLGMYGAFALVIVRQVSIMSEAIEDPLNQLLTAGAWLHLGLAILLVMVAVVVL